MTISNIVKNVLMITPFLATNGIATAKEIPDQVVSFRPINPHSSSKSILPTHLTIEPLQSQTMLTKGGGYGGNERTGQFIYDGLPDHLMALTISRDDKGKYCYLENESATIYYYNFFGSLKPVYYYCPTISEEHNNVYWNDKLDLKNGAYNIENDALYGATLTDNMFQNWAGVPVFYDNKGAPLSTKIVTGVNTAPKDVYRVKEKLIVLSDGNKELYPLSPYLLAYIMGIAFTMQQHPDLNYSHPTSGAIAHAFSALTAEALKFYIHGENDWQIGSEVTKTGTPWYYMDQPTKDCGFKTPGNNCSIDHFSRFKSEIDPHYTSGIYRRAFYLLATTSGWDIKKVFTVAIQANRFYWTSKQDFSEGYCGLVKAARDLNYEEADVTAAFKAVGIESSKPC